VAWVEKKMRELPGQRGHNAVPRVKQNGCGRRKEGKGHGPKNDFGEVGELVEEKFHLWVG